jgi:MYXO-CTERM domain-containing protein
LCDVVATDLFLETPVMLLQLALLLPGTAQAGDLFVETSGVNTSNSCVSSDSPCGTIAYAVEVATAGDRIVLGSGTFAASSLLVNDLIFEGQGQDATLVEASYAQVFKAIAGHNEDASLTLKGMAIEGAYGAVEVSAYEGAANLSMSSVALAGSGSTGIVYDADRGVGALTLHDVDVYWYYGGPAVAANVRGSASLNLSDVDLYGTSAGFVLDGGTDADVDLSIDGAVLEGAYGEAIKINGAGVLNAEIQAAELVGLYGLRATVDAGDYFNVTLSNSLLSDHDETSVEVAMKTSATLFLELRENTIVEAGAAGGDAVNVFMDGAGNSANVFMESNYLANNAGDCVVLSATHNMASNAFVADLRNNSLVDNGGKAVNFIASSNSVSAALVGNRIEGGGGGVRVYAVGGEASLSLQDNVIRDNGSAALEVYAWSIAGTLTGGLVHNTIEGNGEGVQVLMSGSGSSTLAASENWWGVTDDEDLDDLIWDGNDAGYGPELDAGWLEDTLDFTLSEDEGGLGGGLTITVDRADEAPPFTQRVGADGFQFDDDGELEVIPSRSDIEVWFGDIPAYSLEWVSADQLEVVVPPTLHGGSVDVLVINSGGQSGVLSEGFEYKSDLDGDGWFDDIDNCVEDYNLDQLNTDELDDGGDACDDDDDEDGDLDNADNCPVDVNADQADLDEDGFGDACDWDDDNDGTADEEDLCPSVWDDQADNDDDDVGDACDDDDDDDGDLDVDDNCPVDANADQADADEDGFGDECDWDDDNDGVADDDDVCPDVWDWQLNTDGEDDGGDACDEDDDDDDVDDDDDNCPVDANADQADADADGQGDACDPDFGFISDADEDGVLDDTDNCPDDANSDQADNDEDGDGDDCDNDDDDDGVKDNKDNCAFDANADQADDDGDEIGDACDPDYGVFEDADGDGVIDSVDNCVDDANSDQYDNDEDGAGDLCDDDDDDDTVLDVDDNCPWDANTTQDNDDGDSQGDVCDPDFGLFADADEDGVRDDVDNCSEIANSDQLDLDGDHIGDVCDGDDDGDAISDGDDNCPAVANDNQSDLDGDGLGDACDGDLDGDGVDNVDDNCVTTRNEDQNDDDEDGRGDACDDATGGANAAGETALDSEDATTSSSSCSTSPTAPTGFAGLVLGALALIRRR